jgi:hypothetical protein
MGAAAEGKGKPLAINYRRLRGRHPEAVPNTLMRRHGWSANFFDCRVKIFAIANRGPSDPLRQNHPSKAHRASRVPVAPERTDCTLHTAMNTSTIAPVPRLPGFS